MSKLFKVCLDIEGNDKGLAITTVAADSDAEAIEKAKKHVGAMNPKVKAKNIIVKGCKKVGKNGCITDHYVPRDWVA